MTQLINTFLLLAKNDTRQLPIESINVSAHVDHVSDKLAYLLSDKPIKLVKQITASATCQANPALFDIVLSNLIRNAFQYTHEGHIEISYSEKQLTVKDTGFGIPSNEIENINQAFYSLQPDGVGLGLSIVHRIIWSLGWQLIVQSQTGEGTQVTLLFEP